MRTLIRPGAFQDLAGVPQAVAPSSVNGPVSQADRSVEPATPAGSLVRTLCSWCSVVIVDVPAPADGRVSHGVCQPCFDRVMGEAA